MVAGDRRVHVPLPAVGWFPDEDLPPALPGRSCRRGAGRLPLHLCCRASSDRHCRARRGVPSMKLTEVVLEVHDHLDATGVTHAFGGALALDQIVDPRGTVDIDVNVFAAESLQETIAKLRAPRLSPGARGTGSRADCWTAPTSHGRPFPARRLPTSRSGALCRDSTSSCRPSGTRAPAQLPFLSVEDLTVFKALVRTRQGLGRPPQHLSVSAGPRCRLRRASVGGAAGPPDVSAWRGCVDSSAPSIPEHRASNPFTLSATRPGPTTASPR